MRTRDEKHGSAVLARPMAVGRLDRLVETEGIAGCLFGGLCARESGGVLSTMGRFEPIKWEKDGG